MNLSDGLEEHLRLMERVNDTGRTRGDYLGMRLRITGRAQADDANARSTGLESAHGSVGRGSPQVEIHEDNMRLPVLEQLLGLGDVVGLTDHNESLLGS